MCGASPFQKQKTGRGGGQLSQLRPSKNTPSCSIMMHGSMMGTLGHANQFPRHVFGVPRPITPSHCYRTAPNGPTLFADSWYRGGSTTSSNWTKRPMVGDHQLKRPGLSSRQSAYPQPLHSQQHQSVTTSSAHCSLHANVYDLAQASPVQDKSNLLS